VCVSTEHVLYQRINSTQTVNRKSDAGFSTELKFSRVSLSSLVKSGAYNVIVKHKTIVILQQHRAVMWLERTKDRTEPPRPNSSLNQTAVALTPLFTIVIFLKFAIKSVTLCYATRFLTGGDGGTE